MKENRSREENERLEITKALAHAGLGAPRGLGAGARRCTATSARCWAPRIFFTTTEPDGTFELIASSNTLEGVDTFLVVRKGQFLRIEPIVVQVGEQAVAEALTQLPGVNDPAAGQWIPRIAVYDTWPDAGVARIPNSRFFVGEMALHLELGCRALARCARHLDGSAVALELAIREANAAKAHLGASLHHVIRLKTVGFTSERRALIGSEPPVRVARDAASAATGRGPDRAHAGR